jgi:hypothetical protein
MTKYQIDKIIFKYLDNKNYIILKSETSTYFLENRDDEYAQIRLRNDGFCFIYWRLIEEISSFFSMEKSDSEQVIGKWVGNTLQTEVTSTCASLVMICCSVGNTLQTEVTSTISPYCVGALTVGNTLQTEVTSTGKFGR